MRTTNMIVDGKKIAEDIYQELIQDIADFGRAPVLTIITCAPHFATQKYLNLKQARAKEVGIKTEIRELSADVSTQDIIDAITHAIPQSDGIVVQLPLPSHIAQDRVIEAIPTTHDVDALNPHTLRPLSPVVGAIEAIVERHGVQVKDTFVAVVGSGKLVGIPAYQWFVSQGAHVSVVTRDVSNIEDYTKNADIVVCGAGVPSLIKPAMVREGVIIFDAGTSEEGGVLRGDADPSCALKSSLFTPVPGGIGPLTIAILLKNVVHCARQKRDVV